MNDEIRIEYLDPKQKASTRCRRHGPSISGQRKAAWEACRISEARQTDSENGSGSRRIASRSGHYQKSLFEDQR